MNYQSFVRILLWLRVCILPQTWMLFSKVRTWPLWRILYGYSKTLGQIQVKIKNPFFVTRMLQNVMIRLWSLWISNRHEMQLIMQSTFRDRNSVLCRAFLKAGLCVFLWGALFKHPESNSVSCKCQTSSLWLLTNYCLCWFPVCYISCFHALAESVLGAITNDFFNSSQQIHV